jgi:hypothetical protein
VQARQIGYPDMEKLIYQVLATRPATADAPYSPAEAQESVAVMAMFLALIDPAAAKQALRTIEPGSDAIGLCSTGMASRADWLEAWALVDPRHAAELAEKELASANSPEAAQGAQNDVMEVMTLWTIAPGQRLNYLSRGLLRDCSLPEDY